MSGQNGQFARVGSNGVSEAETAARDELLQRELLMERTVDLLIQKAKVGELWPDVYERALAVLESLPLPTSEFDLASRRLRNALAYAASGEFGAAAFELRMLRSQLA